MLKCMYDGTAKRDAATLGSSHDDWMMVQADELSEVDSSKGPESTKYVT